MAQSKAHRHMSGPSYKAEEADGYHFLSYPSYWIINLSIGYSWYADVMEGYIIQNEITTETAECFLLLWLQFNKRHFIQLYI